MSGRAGCTTAIQRNANRTSESRQQRSISPDELWPRDLAAEYLALVPQRRQLDVLQVQAAATPNECA
jgi:hypothetical protein